MNAFFSSPAVFFAFLAVPALVAIYLLRNRFRIHHVSSLLLWHDQKTAREGGLNLERIQTPLLFILELLAIAMLILAAAGPVIRSGKETRIFVIVLDDSFSMLAGDEAAPRARAVEETKRLLASSGKFRAHFILAGKTPRLIDEPVTSAAQAADILDGWKCRGRAADLSKGIALANELAGQVARILVVTDHEPAAVLEQGRMVWWAFGNPLPNLAFVNASRTSVEGRDRCLLAVANFSDEPISGTLTLESLNDPPEAVRKPLELGPRQVHRTFFEPKTDSAGLRARLEHDSLDIDNEVTLVAESPKPVRVQVRIQDEILRSAVSKALEAVKSVRLNSVEPHLLITDAREPAPAAAGLWTVQIVSDPDPSAYVGPFIMDHSHPLTEGLSLEGVIWGAGKAGRFTGLPIIAAGNIPLVTDRESAGGSHGVSVNLNPQFSTMLQSPNWPILMWNLVQWRRSFLPGLAQANILLGSSIRFTKELREKEVFLVDSENNSTPIAALAESMYVEPDMPGLYTLRTDGSRHLFSVNAVSESESNLTQAQTGIWGQWRQSDLYWWEYRPLDWILLLIALALLTAHRFITASNREGVRI